MLFEPVNLGFTTADADAVELTFDKGDVVLRFVDWQESSVCVAFREVIGFSWNDELDLKTHRDDTTYEVRESPWLTAQLRLAATPNATDYAHYRLCFNASGVLDVLTRRHDVFRG